MRIHRRTLLAGLATCSLASPVLAQTAVPTRIRGTIESAEGQTLKIESRNGETVTVTLRPDTGIVAITPATISDIKPGSFIGTAAMPQPDGSQVALEVHIFPENMRGTGEGHRPYDLQPQSTMTNGTVGDVVGTEGRNFTVRYKGGEKKIEVPASVPIITFEPGDRSLLTAGAHVIVIGSKAPDGSISLDRVLVGKNGLAPPM
jgi:hypothetical protein